jgi:hypothetical protein
VRLGLNHNKGRGWKPTPKAEAYYHNHSPRAVLHCRMRNGLAGKFTGKSESSRYFASNPEARRKKNAYNKRYHASEERKRYRAELNAANRRMGREGDGRDVSHTASGRVVLERASSNRARNGKGGRRLL